MHTYNSKNNIAFHHNSDFSGEVIIQNEEGKEFHVQGADILAFVAYCYILPEKISRLEDMNFCDLLKDKTS